MRLSKRGKMTIVGVLGILICLLVFLYFMLKSPVYKNIECEAGQDQITVKDFLRNKDTTATLKTAITEDVLHTVGEYEITIDINGKEYQSMLIVKDTIAPQATALKVEVYQNEKIEPNMFVTDIKDATDVKVSFEKDQITTKELGNYDVHIVLEDTSSNKTVIQSTLVVKKDDIAPVINGTKDITVIKGQAVSYKKDVTVADNIDKEVELKIDTSNVNLNKVGKYKVTYTATDSALNTTTKTIYVHVINEGGASEADVYAKADQVLAKIITNSMTKREKCRKIYDWVRSNVSYVSDSDKSSWTKAAMQAFDKHKGDCYNYWAVTKALLTRANIENIDLKATKHTHFWNFVKVEEGWYHLDTTPRVDHPNLFLRTDAWIDAYSIKHKNCFSYEPNSKPASAKK